MHLRDIPSPSGHYTGRVETGTKSAITERRRRGTMVVLHGKYLYLDLQSTPKKLPLPEIMGVWAIARVLWRSR